MRGRVILIEDNPLHGKLYCAVLRSSGYRPFLLTDPRTALIEIKGDEVVAAIIDIRLPHIDGRTIIRQVRDDSKAGDLPILALSAFADQDMEETCLAAGADRFRAKPVPLMTLARDIEQLIVTRAAAAGG